MKKNYIICGSYGSGKTEFCINFALYLYHKFGEKVSIADFDVINPYFRSRDKAKFLSRFGMEILGNFTDNKAGTDLPALSSNVHGALFRNEFLIIDLAGSHNGIKPLALIRENFSSDNCEFLVVLNAFRPGTSNAEEMINTIKTLEFQGDKITGIVHNSHLVRETDAEAILYGQEIVLKVSDALNLPVLYTQIREDLYSKIKHEIKGMPIVFNDLSMREKWL